MQPNSPSSLLGLSQQQTALLLGIDRGLYSMFELGKRSLPLSAQLRLTTLLLHMQSLKPTQQTQNPKQQTTYLQTLLRENQLKHHRLTRKIQTLQRKLDSARRLSHLLQLLNKEADQKKPDPALALIQLRAAKLETDEQEKELFQLQIQLELNINEAEMLKFKISQTEADSK